ncbi:NUDIX hydrolase [Aeoliella sp.]|uniref:NUDIX hydrolase n=1 Tax=Aeoliella sp. TaxID=2795800 RepID=UPI003CCC26B0
MYRYELVQTLQRYLVLYPHEEPTVTRIVELVEQHPDCFERTCRPGHITGAAWVVSADHRHMALVHHRKLDRWLQPGGHADGDGDVVNVAWREATEELGLSRLLVVETGGSLVPLDVDVHDIPPRYDADGQLVEDAHQHHDIRFLFVASDRSLEVSDESHDVQWFDEQQLRELTAEQSVLRLMEKALQWLS